MSGLEPPFPRTVRIGFRTYRIQQWTPAEASSAEKYGQIDYTTCVIAIDVQHGPFQTAATLYHELLHGVLNMAGTPDEAEVEQTVTAAANGLAEVMIANPVLSDWLHWALHFDRRTEA